MRCSPKYDIIHVYLNNQKIVALTQQEKSFINIHHFETLSFQKLLDTIIPCSRSCLKTIQSFSKLENTVWELGVFETRGLFYINFFNKSI